MEWAGESYSPDLFASLARKQGVTIVELRNGGTTEILCSIAVASAMKARAFAGPEVNGGARELDVSNAPTISDACTKIYKIPKPKLASGQYYVASSGKLVGIESERPIRPADFATRLSELGATGIVLRHYSISDVLCFSTIAEAAGIKLFEVRMDGSLGELGIEGSYTLQTACAAE